MKLICAAGKENECGGSCCVAETPRKVEYICEHLRILCEYNLLKIEETD